MRKCRKMPCTCCPVTAMDPPPPSPPPPPPPHGPLTTADDVPIRPRREANARDLLLWTTCAAIVFVPLVVTPWMTRRGIKRIERNLRNFQEAAQETQQQTEAMLGRIRTSHRATSDRNRASLSVVHRRLAANVDRARLEQQKAFNSLDQRFNSMSHELLDAKTKHSSSDRRVDDIQYDITSISKYGVISCHSVCVYLTRIPLALGGSWGWRRLKAFCQKT